MSKFTVIWKDNGDSFMVTTVTLRPTVDPLQLSTSEWADLAHAAECEANQIDPQESQFNAAEDGYDLISVIEGEPYFIY